MLKIKYILPRRQIYNMYTHYATNHYRVGVYIIFYAKAVYIFYDLDCIYLWTDNQIVAN